MGTLVKLYDRVKEGSTSTGTGVIAFGGARAGMRAVSEAATSGDIVTYCIESSPVPSEWEVGRGRVTSGSPWTLARLEVYCSSAGGALVDFSAGDKDVFITASARDISPLDSARTIYISPTGSDATGAGTSGAPYATLKAALADALAHPIGYGGSVTIDVAPGIYANQPVIDIRGGDLAKVSLSTAAAADVTVLSVFKKPAVWASSTAYSLYDVVYHPSATVGADNTLPACLVCTTAGISGGSAPAWPAVGATVSDGSVVWTRLPNYSYYLTVQLDTGDAASATVGGYLTSINGVWEGGGANRPWLLDGAHKIVHVDEANDRLVLEVIRGISLFPDSTLNLACQIVNTAFEFVSGNGYALTLADCKLAIDSASAVFRCADGTINARSVELSAYGCAFVGKSRINQCAAAVLCATGEVRVEGGYLYAEVIALGDTASPDRYLYADRGAVAEVSSIIGGISLKVEHSSHLITFGLTTPTGSPGSYLNISTKSCATINGGNVYDMPSTTAAIAVASGAFADVTDASVYNVTTLSSATANTMTADAAYLYDANA